MVLVIRSFGWEPGPIYATDSNMCSSLVLRFCSKPVLEFFWSLIGAGLAERIPSILDILPPSRCGHYESL
jgi:hypothetical protein